MNDNIFHHISAASSPDCQSDNMQRKSYYFRADDESINLLRSEFSYKEEMTTNFWIIAIDPSIVLFVCNCLCQFRAGIMDLIGSHET